MRKLSKNKNFSMENFLETWSKFKMFLFPYKSTLKKFFHISRYFKNKKKIWALKNIWNFQMSLKALIIKAKILKKTFKISKVLFLNSMLVFPSMKVLFYRTIKRPKDLKIFPRSDNKEKKRVSSKWVQESTWRFLNMK